MATTAMTMRGVIRVCGRPILGSAASVRRAVIVGSFSGCKAISILSMHQFVRLGLQQVVEIWLIR